MRRIVYTSPSGNVCIVTPAFNIREADGWTEADSERRAWNKLPANAINPRWIDPSIIPQDRTFRDAWREDFTIDSEKADIIAAAKVKGK